MHCGPASPLLAALAERHARGGFPAGLPPHYQADKFASPTWTLLVFSCACRTDFLILIQGAILGMANFFKNIISSTFGVVVDPTRDKCNMRGILAVLTILLLPLIGFFLYSPDAPAMSTLNTNDGLGMHIGWNNELDSGDAPLAYLDTAGVKWIRMAVRWYLIEQNRDSYNWNAMYLDDVLPELNAHGFNILVIIHGVPEWIRDQDCVANHPNHPERCPPPPSDDSAFYAELREFIGDASQRWDFIDDWEIWNEPANEVNIAGSATDSMGPMWYGTFEEYDSMVVSVANSLQSEDRLWCCSSSRGFRGEADNNFTANMLSNVGSYIDGVSFHAYDSATTYTDGQRVIDFMEDLMSDLDAVGYSSIPVINSEMGIGVPDMEEDDDDPNTVDTLYNTADATPREVARYMNNVLYAQAQYSQWERTFWFTWNRGPEWSAVDTISDFERAQRDSIAILRRIANSSDPSVVDSVRVLSYCNLVNRADNEATDGLCIDNEITPATQTTVPPNTECTWTASPTEPNYSYIWFRNGFQVSTGESYSYHTPSSGTFTLTLETSDDSGDQGYGWDSMEVTVMSGAMCTN